MGVRSRTPHLASFGGSFIRMTLEQRVQRLEDRAALEELVAAYCRGADTEDADLFSSVWHKDAIWDVGTHVFHGRKEIMTAVARQWDAFPSMHHWTTNSRYFIAGDRASADHDVAALTALGDASSVLSAGHYRDEFERRDGNWKLTKRTAAVLTTVDVSPRT